MSKDKKDDSIILSTSRFGKLEVSQSSVMTIIGGVIGFPDFSKYILLDYNPPFSWLQSIENEDLAFVVVNGAEFGEHYSFGLPFGDRDTDLKEDDDYAVVNLVSVRPDPSDTTVNLKAPLFVNLRTMLGKQIVLDDQRFPMRFPLWSAENADEETGAAGVGTVPDKGDDSDSE